MFWLGFTLFRLIAIVQSRFMKPGTMLWMNLAGCIVTSAGLIFVKAIEPCLILTFFYGASMGKAELNYVIYLISSKHIPIRIQSCRLVHGAGWSNGIEIRRWISDRMDDAPFSLYCGHG
jgi:hypothetical protein